MSCTRHVEQGTNSSHLKTTMATFRVLPSLNSELANTNALYINPSDATTPYVKMGRFVYKCIPHPDVIMGSVCMNAITRRAIYPSEVVTLEEYLVPMTGGPTVVAVQAEYVKRQQGLMPDNLPNAVRNVLEGLVVSVGQQFTLTHEDRAILFQVTDVDAPGVVTMNTEVSLMWLPC
jgi:hypothetical protein